MNMQRKKALIAILIIVGILILLSVAAFVFLFNGGDSGDSDLSHGISFREDSVSIEKFETYTLDLQGAENKQIEWKSNDESIATVQDGVVCGWKKGNTQILACVDGKEIPCNVFVSDNQYIPVIVLRESDEIMMDIGSTYGLKPVLYYNGNAYTDVEYTFSSTGNAVTVDEAGMITAAEPGEALVSVQGTWRSNAVDASLSVYVIDASTSIEVSGTVFDIYLNGKNEEFPSSVDIGISIFDQDTPIQQKDASVKYTELIMEGDVGGAATIKNGVAHAAKIGTAHFVAEYTSLAGDVVRSAVFTVNVHKSPADIYMSPIAGEEYESFISPANPMNSVKWDESLGAFHLTNVNAAEDDGRAFMFSRDYIEKILQYTNAKSIVFEVKRDGISSGSLAPDQVIYQGFYPEWYDPNEFMRIDNCGEWTKIEIFFDKIPLDADGNRKAIMILSTKEGMYIRNIRPMTEGLFLTMDVEITTTAGNWNKDIEIGAFPHSYKGSINGDCSRATVRAGVKTTVKFRLDDFLENGKIPGFGLVVFGGPEWDAKLPDGYTPDRHTLKISNLRVSGERNYKLDLSTASWASGKNGTGYTDANGSGTPTYEDGTIIITNGFCYDGHKFTLDSEEAKNRTYIYMDMEITTLGNSSDPVEVRFYAHNFDGSVHASYTDKMVVTAGKKSTVKLNLANYMIDGQFPGIGFAIFGGPTWDAKLPDGYTPDRHTVTISNMHLEGKLEQLVDLSGASVVTGFADSNSGGTAAVVDGAIVASGGFCYDGHMITFGEGKDPEGTEPSAPEKSYLCVDLLITTLGNSTEPVDVGFFPYNFEGDINNYTDKIPVTAGTQATVKLELDKYLVDGKLPGIGFAIFGGPEWDAKLPDGYTPDRHTITMSGIYLEGGQSTVYDLSKSVWASGTNGTGYTNANGSGVAEIGSSIVITNGFRYDGHKISLSAENTENPPEEDPSTYICMDLLFTTLSNSTAPLEIGFFPYNFEGDINNMTDRVIVTAGTTANIKLDAEEYLVDGEISGIGFAIFGGPAWDAKLPDGYTPDRHTITISNARLEGAESKVFDLSKSLWASGTNGTGYTNANGSGVATIDSEIVISNGFRYDGHKISLVAGTEPGETEQETYVVLDMQIDTLGGNWNKDIEMRFYAYNFEGNPHEVYTDSLIFKAGEQTTVKLEAEKYLVDGKLTGIGIGIFGGPTWDAKLPDGYTPDRHMVTISSVKLEGKEPKTYDLSKSVCISGTGDTGYTVANGSGVAAFTDGALKITNGFCYDCHKISLVEAQEPSAEEENTYLSMDILITTLSNSADPVDVCFYPHGFAGNVFEEYTEKLTVTAGTKTTVQIELSKYLVDGKLPGIGFAIFGGPEWNTQISPGVYDRHTVTVSNMRLEGKLEQTIDLSDATITTGFANANSGGTAAVVDGNIVSNGGYRYDGHMITFGAREKRGLIRLNDWLSFVFPAKKES